MTVWTQGACSDGLVILGDVILRDGVPVPIEDVLTTLNKTQAILQKMWDEYNRDENCDQVVLNDLLEEAADLLELQP